MIWSISDFRDIAERLRTRRGAHSSSPKDWHGQRSNEAQWGKKRTSAPKCYCIWDVMPKNFEGRGKGSLLAGELYFALKRMRKTSTTSGTVANMATSNPAQLVINAAVFCVKKVMTICKSFTDRGPNNLSHIRCVENCFSTRVCAAFPNRLRFPASCKRVLRADESDSRRTSHRIARSAVRVRRLYPTMEFVVHDLEGLHRHGLETCDASVQVL